MNRDEYVDALKAKIDEWNEQIGKAEAQMNQATADAQARYEAQVAEMKQHAEEAQAKLQELGKAQTEEWDKQRANFEAAWKDISEGFGRAWSRFF